MIFQVIFLQIRLNYLHTNDKFCNCILNNNKWSHESVFKKLHKDYNFLQLQYLYFK